MNLDYDILSKKVKELKNLSVSVYRLSKDLKPDNFTKVAFVMHCNELLNQILKISLLTADDDADQMGIVGFSELFTLLQPIQDIHDQAQKAKRVFRKAALRLVLDNDLPPDILSNLERGIWSLYLLLKNLSKDDKGTFLFKDSQEYQVHGNN